MSKKQDDILKAGIETRPNQYTRLTNALSVIKKNPFNNLKNEMLAEADFLTGKLKAAYELSESGKGKDLLAWGEACTEAINFISRILEYWETIKPVTFALPSHDIMLTLLAMFAGKPEHIPRKLLAIPHKDRTPEQKQQAEDFINSYIERKIDTSYSSEGEPQQTESRVAMVSDSPVVEAQADIDTNLFKKDLSFREEALAFHIKKAYGPEGLRHLMGLLIGLEENFRSGTLNWNINEHLGRLGYRKKQGGAYDLSLKETACEIVNIFTSFCITAHRKTGNKTRIKAEKLFSLDGFEIEAEELTSDTLKEGLLDGKGTLTIRATDFWYRNAFDPPEGGAPQYTKLLKKIAQENHTNHPLTIYLAPLLAVFWRINPKGKQLRIKSLMNWCNLDYRTQRDGGSGNRMRDIKKLEAELNYMKSNGYLGDWVGSGDKPLPSDCKDPLNCVIDMTPPDWLKKEFLAIESKKEEFKQIDQAKDDGIIALDDFQRLFHNTSMTVKEFGNHLGVSRQMISYILNGKRTISRKLSKKVYEVFGDQLPT